MTFSEAQFQAAVDKINNGMTDLSAKMGEILPAAQAGLNHWYIPDFVKDAVMALAREALDLAKWLWDKFVELLKGVGAPVMFFKYAYDWSDVRGIATGVAGVLKPEALTVDEHWKGTAADRYNAAIKPQSEAADKIGTISEKLTIALGILAAAGLTFYVALGVIIVQFIVAMVGVVAALGSVAFSWAGVALAVGEAGFSSAAIATAVGALVAILGVQAQQMSTLNGEAKDAGKFPGGHWPDPTTGNYSDATVTDGDADWAFES